MAGNITVIVVDDHSLFRAGVIQTLQLDRAIKVVGEGGSADEAIELAESLRPHVALLDVAMPGNGIEAAKSLMKLENPPKMVMLTVSEADSDIMASLEAGAVGYVLKGIKANDLIAAVKNVAAGDSFVSPNLTLRILTRAKSKPPVSRLSSLTRQEERTLRLIAEGLSNREIAERLGITEPTVKFHVGRILQKLGARNRVEATVLAEREWGRQIDGSKA